MNTPFQLHLQFCPSPTLSFFFPRTHIYITDEAATIVLLINFLDVEYLLS
jgi:hypothetical protein